MAFRNVFVKFSEEKCKQLMTGNLHLKYTGNIYFDVVFPERLEDDFSWPGGGIFSPPDGDIYYCCECDLKELRSFRKVEPDSDSDEFSESDDDNFDVEPDTGDSDSESDVNLEDIF